MPVFAVSAVDTTANTLTATGVAASGGALGTVLQTGDRLRLRNVGGALPAATPSLAPVTDYFAIRVDDDHIKLAVSNSDAMAGTAIDITGGLGAGTTEIQFNLPYCVPRIDAGGTQVFSRDNNATWNSLVALYDLLTGQAQSVFSGVSLAGDLAVGGHLKTVDPITFSAGFGVPNVGGSTASVGVSVGGVAVLFLGTSVGVHTFPLILPVGLKITAWSMQFNKTSNATQTLHATLTSNDGTSDVATSIGSTQTNAANNPGFISLGQAGLSTVVAAGSTYFINVFGSGVTGDFVYGYSVTPGI